MEKQKTPEELLWGAFQHLEKSRDESSRLALRLIYHFIRWAAAPCECNRGPMERAGLCNLCYEREKEIAYEISNSTRTQRYQQDETGKDG